MVEYCLEGIGSASVADILDIVSLEMENYRVVEQAFGNRLTPSL
jgi:hypothetical protein